MTKKIIALDANKTLDQVEKIFDENNIHHLPITEDGKMVGIISKSDFLLFKRGFVEFSTEKKYDLFKLKTHTAGFIMTKGLAKLEPTDKINVALEVFRKNILHALPVIDEGNLVGIVTTHDIISHLAADHSVENQYV